MRQQPVAVAGKNPVSHVGKLYNVAAHHITRDVVAEVAAVTEACCWLVSRIGHPVTEPRLCELKLRLAPGAELAEVLPRAVAVVERHLARIGTLWRELIDPAVELC